MYLKKIYASFDKNSKTKKMSFGFSQDKEQFDCVLETIKNKNALFLMLFFVQNAMDIRRSELRFSSAINHKTVKKICALLL